MLTPPPLQNDQPAQAQPSALHGLRILDFTRVLAGPFCTMLLADLGADVIKIEQPGQGDETRAWGPPFAGSASPDGESPGLSAYYLSVNRNKRSLTLNLKTPEGRTLARDLTRTADVLVENFKVGQMAGYGLGYDTLHAEQPGLVYCSITGYGQDGPYAERPGYDFVIQAQSGLMSITGPVGVDGRDGADGTSGEPYKTGVAIADVITGLFAANSIQAALHHRQRTAQGQHIDIALLDSQIAALVNVASNYLVSGKPPARYGNAHASIVPYESFQASDGAFVLAVGNDAQFRRCCEVIGQAGWADDPRFATNPARVANRASLVALLRAVFRQRTARAWVEAFLSAGVPAGPINDIPAMFADPHVQARGLVQQVALSDGMPVDLLGPTPRLSETPPTVRSVPPTLGQHTDQILRDVLGLDAATIADYRLLGII